MVDVVAATNRDRVWHALETVMDPEIPVLSIVEMGMIAAVDMDAAGLTIKLTPTFAGCPAIDLIRDNVRSTAGSLGLGEVRVEIVYDPPWSSDRITEEGRRKLREFGLAPPVRDCGGGRVTEAQLAYATCPYCHSDNTSLESIFGPTLCRSMHYCNNCRQSFEQFKPV